LRNNYKYKTNKPYAIFKPNDHTTPHNNTGFLNTRSLSAYPNGENTDKQIRHDNMINLLQNILTIVPSLCLQECKLNAEDTVTLKNEFPHHQIFYNNLKKGEGGTIIMIHKSYKKYYTATNYRLIKGRIQLARLNPINTTLSPINIINVHIPSNETDKHIKKLLTIDGSIHTILGGDFNFTEHAIDNPSDTSKLTISGETLTTWIKVKQHFKFREIHQPIHTHYAPSEKITETRTSRIDRIYTNHSDADFMMVNPITYIHHINTTEINERRYQTDPVAPFMAPYEGFISDHLPIILSHKIHSVKEKKRKQKREVPRWLAEDEGIIRSIEANWDENEQDPYKALDRFSEAVGQASDSYFSGRNHIKVKVLDSAAKLNIIIKYLKTISAIPLNTDKQSYYKNTYPFIKEIDDNEDINIHITAISTYTDGLLRATVIVLPPTEPPLPPSTTPSSDNAHTKRIQNIKKNLPNTRTFINAVRPDLHSPPISDKKEMGTHMHNHWSKLWEARDNEPEANELDEYTEDYTVRVDGSTMHFPSVDKIEDFILRSNNSSAGPNRTPFAFIRKFSRKLAPIVRAVMVDIAMGHTPPSGFNFGKLFFFPKKGTLLPGDHRPITVSNAISRIIAKLLGDIMTPELLITLAPEQAGFLRGRKGDRHIYDITNRYYSSLNKEEQMFILFLDTEKAFDSIDHNFIHHILGLMGFPAWIRNSIKGLMHNIKVFPQGIDCDPIDIRRGVKQGCPLSPLLFIICFDVLLRKLRSPERSSYGFADDLALATKNLAEIIKALHIVEDFAKFTGLGLNIKKTVILTSLKVTYADEAELEYQGYKIIKFVDKTEYLGIIIGREISTVDIAEKAMAKFQKRVNSYSHNIARSSLHERILIFNIFLLPLFNYIAQYYILPYEQVIIKARNIARKHIIPYDGTAWGYALLVATELGPHTPLRDLWAHNMALLSHDFNFQPSHGQPTPIIPTHLAHVTKPEWGDLIVEENRAYAAFLYMEDHNPRGDGGLINTKHIKGSGPNKRAKIYKDLVNMGYWRPRESELKSFPTSIPHKASKWNGDTPLHNTSHIKTLASHRKHVKKHSTATVWNNFFRAFLNAWPTDHRRHSAGMCIQGRPNPPFLCYICGKGEDKIDHLLGDCETVRAAFVITMKAVGKSLTYSLGNCMLLFPAEEDPTLSVTTAHFVSSVWRERREYFSTLPHTEPITTAANRIATTTLNSLPINKKGGKSKSQARITGIAQQRAANPTGLTIFTDGSEIKKEGHCGAGLWVTLHTIDINIEINISMALGPGDNNLGEMMGLLVANIITNEIITFLGKTLGDAITFSDSLGCIAYLTTGWPNPTTDEVAHKTRKFYRKVTDNLEESRLYWIKGHDNITGNEIADKLAKLGSRASIKKFLQKGDIHITLDKKGTISALDEIITVPNILKELRRIEISQDPWVV
jgi:ribonuclease HI